MKTRPGSSRVLAVALLAACLPACSTTVFPGFGGDSCRTVYVLSGGVVQPVNTCGGVPRERLQGAFAVATVGGDLAALLGAPKFEPDDYYTGVDAPEDKAPLTGIVNGAIRDLIGMPEPRPASRVRQRLALAVEAVDEFATEDREHAYVYLVLAWRAAGLTGESGLLPVPDDRVLDAF